MQATTQSFKSNVGAALIGAVAKHNERNKDRRVLFINCGGLAPELTNEMCDFWHFRFSMHAGHTEQRFHYVSFERTLVLDEGSADLVATLQK